MIVNVNTTAALSNALRAAHGGDTVKLAAGVYSGLSLRDMHFAGDVTITSQSASAPGVIAGLSLTSVSGLTFQDLDFQAAARVGSIAFQVSSSQDIHFRRLDVHGSLNGNPVDDPAGFQIRESSDVSVEDSELQQLNFGISQLNNDHLLISGNVFHDLRLDGIRGGGSGFVTVSDNVFRDFHPRPADHPDAIQFWTNASTPASHDLVITGNQVIRGSGDMIQGVFLRDELGDAPYRHVLIRDNLVAGARYNGILVTHGVDVAITRNVVQGFTDEKSWIRIEAVDRAVVSGNAANQVTITAAATHVMATDNAILPLATDGGASALQLWRTDQTPTQGLTLFGDAGANTLTGSDLADTLTGGAGGDVLSGGGGDDVYVLDGRPLDLVESPDGGVDTVRSPAAYALPDNVDNLVITGNTGVIGSGNATDNVIAGNDGANRLNGRSGADTLLGGGGADRLAGGRGDDALTGGPGADKFVFTRNDGHDVIHDFGAGGSHDAIDASALFAGGAEATLAEAAAGVTISFSTSGVMVLVEGIHAADLHATSSGWVY